MDSLKELLKQKDVKRVLIWSILIGTVLIFPYLIYDNGLTTKTFRVYMKEVGFAIFVALPILITIEMFNQRRHQKMEHQQLKDQAVSLVRRGVPDEIWALINESVIETSFYRDDFVVSYVLILKETPEGTEYVEVQISISFKVRRMRGGLETLPVSASLLLSEDAVCETKFTRIEVGTNKYNETTLKDLCIEQNGHLVVSEIPQQVVPDNQSLKVVIEGETAFSLQSSFEAFIMAMPATGLTINVDASSELKVDLDELHPHPMSKVKDPTANNKWTWTQKSGLVEGQGAVIRWRRV